MYPADMLSNCGIVTCLAVFFIAAAVHNTFNGYSLHISGSTAVCVCLSLLPCVPGRVVNGQILSCPHIVNIKMHTHSAHVSVNCGTCVLLSGRCVGCCADAVSVVQGKLLLSFRPAIFCSGYLFL